jgi:hypothetical protein
MSYFFLSSGAPPPRLTLPPSFFSFRFFSPFPLNTLLEPLLYQNEPYFNLHLHFLLFITILVPIAIANCLSSL